MRVTPQTNRTSRRGFTLLELLLVTVLVLLLVGAMVFNFSSLLRGHQLEEGTTRLETLMRFARAQAANSGRKVQLVFASESTNETAASTGEVRATWEPDPLGQPGWFADLCDAQWHVQEVNDLVQVESVTLLDPSTACPTSTACEAEPAAESQTTDALTARSNRSPITFYPDGSSDSAEIVLAARSPDEDQRMAVRLIGMTGSISHQRLIAALGDEPGVDAGAVPSSLFDRSESTVRDLGREPESTPRPLSTLPPASSMRPASAPLRAPVGDTNTVNSSE